jgi:hypothetical protein
MYNGFKAILRIPNSIIAKLCQCSVLEWKHLDPPFIVYINVEQSPVLAWGRVSHLQRRVDIYVCIRMSRATMRTPAVLARNPPHTGGVYAFATPGGD